MVGDVPTQNWLYQMSHPIALVNWRVSYMINEDIKHIKWQYQYTITDITHENWIQLLMQYANKIDNKKLISFVYNEVNKIP